MRTSLLVFLLAVVPFIAGCQTWTRGGDYASAQGFKLSTPPAWIYHPAMGGEFLATQDGIFLQRLTATRVPLTTPLPHNKRMLAATFTPFEIAETVIDDFKADHSLQQLVIVENTPASLGDKPAARLVLDYRLEDGTHLRNIRYLCIQADQLYVVGLMAPARHYFAAALPDFEATVRSFAFTPAQ